MSTTQGDGDTEAEAEPGDAREAVADLPPSSKLVYKLLQWHGRLTQQQIIEESLLSGRTVRDAIDRLQRRGVVEEGVYYRDARQNVYTLSEGSN